MKAVLLIHGFATDQNDFAPLVPYLWSRYDEVVCPNIPAHGKSAKKERLNHKKIISFVEDLFDDLASRHQTVDIIGFSMGGTLATYLASTRKVNRLILLAAANRFFAPWFIFSTLGCFWSHGRERKAIKKGRVKTSKYNMTSKEIRKDIGTSLRLFFGTIVRRYTPKNLSEFFKVIKFCNKHLCDINCPALILWGKLDQFVKHSSLKHVAAHCKNSDTYTIVYPDISHIMLYSKAQYRICDDILQFLNKTEPPLLCYRENR